jgi:hypothetical protein
MSMRGRHWLVLAILFLLAGVAAYLYPFDRTPPQVTATPEPGTYRDEISVVLAADEPGSTILYSLGEGEPAPYLAPIPLRRDATVRFLAVDSHGNRSQEKSAAYQVRLDTTPPVTTATPPGNAPGTKTFHPVAVSLLANEPAVIHYTVDGSPPGDASPRYSEPIALDKPVTLRFFAVDPAGNREETRTESYNIIIDNTRPYTLAQPGGGLFNRPVTVKLTVNKANARVYYTLDNSKPTTRSPQYQGPIPVSSPSMLRFFAIDEAGNVESPREERYIIDSEPPAVSASPRGGAANRAIEVALTASKPGIIRYDLDGEASDSSALYARPLRLERSATLTFFAVDQAGNRSPLARESYVVDTVPPVTVARPPGGNYAGRIRVKLETGEPDAVIHYTTDGSEPNLASARFTGQGAVAIERPLSLAFFAVDKVGNREAVRRENYSLDQTPPRTAAEPAGGNFTEPVSVALRSEPGAVIRYTVDGRDPSDSSPAYQSPVPIARETVLKFFAVGETGAREAVRSERYLFDTTLPVTTIDPPGGIFNKPVSVTLRNSKGAQVQVRIEGQGEYAPYKGPFVMAKGGKVSWYSQDAAGNREAAQSAEFVIKTDAPVTVPYPAPGEYNPPITLELSTEEGARIHYTLDGTEPTAVSPVFAAPVQMRDDFTVRFFAVDKAGNRERTRSAAYRVRSGMWREFSNGVFIHPSVLDGEYLWVGEPEGLFRITLASQKREHYTRADGLASDAIRALAVDRLGFRWIGTDKGLSQFDGRKNWVTYDYGDGLASNFINCIVIDAAGNKWIGTDRGLSRYNGKSFASFTTANGFPGNEINALAIDANGVFWVGTGKGLAKWDGNRVEKVFTRADGLPGDQVTAVAVDGRWNVWVGTRENGVARYDGRKWASFGPAEGMGGSSIYTIAIDLGDNKWFGTDKGVFKNDGRGFSRVDMPVYK